MLQRCNVGIPIADMMGSTMWSLSTDVPLVRGQTTILEYEFPALLPLLT